MNETLKKQIRNNLILILIGLIIITIFFNEKTWLRYFNILAIFLILKCLIWFISNSEEILFYIFPTKTIREKKSTQIDRIAKNISMPLFFTGLGLLILQMDSIDYLIDEIKFWKIFGFIGLISSILILLILRKMSNTIFQDSGRRYTIIFGFILGITFLTISSASFTNSYTDNKSIETEYFVTKKSKGGKRRKTMWIFINIDNSEKRFKVYKNLWKEIDVGDKVIIEMKKGKLGYKIVEKIKPTANNG